MSEVDRLIERATEAEERDLLARLGHEPHFVAQVFGLFRGRNGWVNVVLAVVTGVGFVAGALAAWEFFRAGDALEALRWGLPAMTLILMSLIIKMAMWPGIHASRLAEQLRLTELRLAARTSPPAPAS